MFQVCRGAVHRASSYFSTRPPAPVIFTSVKMSYWGQMACWGGSVWAPSGKYKGLDCLLGELHAYFGSQKPCSGICVLSVGWLGFGLPYGLGWFLVRVPWRHGRIPVRTRVCVCVLNSFHSQSMFSGYSHWNSTAGRCVWSAVPVPLRLLATALTYSLL